MLVSSFRKHSNLFIFRREYLFIFHKKISLLWDLLPFLRFQFQFHQELEKQLHLVLPHHQIHQKLILAYHLLKKVNAIMNQINIALEKYL